MDKELLKSFNNLSTALQYLADTLQQNSERTEASGSSIADALKDMNMGEQFKAIDENLKKVVEAQDKIVESQKTLDESVKKLQADNATFQKEQIDIQKKTSDIVEKISAQQDDDSKKIESTAQMVKGQGQSQGASYLANPNQKKTITDGVKIILLIAGGILAIGLAFKIIGQVNFLSVLALSISLPLIAIATEKISQMDIDSKALENNLLALLGFTIAAVVASHILSRTAKVTPEQGVTVLLIGAAFAALSLSLNKLTQNIKDISLKSLVMMPLVLVTASFAIMLSSYILSKVSTITTNQAITVVLISAAFTLLSYNLDKLTKNIIGVSMKGLLLMPLVLVAASFAIALSSYILSAVRPVGFLQILTTIGIAAAFAVLSFGLVSISQAVGKINPRNVLLMPLVLVAVSLSIMLSSAILSGVTPISFDKFMTSVGIAIVFIPISFALPFIAKAVSKVDIAKAMIMPVILVALATAIMASSHILIFTAPIDGGLLWNIVLQSLTLGIIGITMGATIWVLDKLGFASKAGFQKLFYGALAIVAIAGTIATTSHILAAGNYSIAPSLSWTLLSAASILVYGILIGVVGSIIKLAGAGNVATAMLAGTLAILAIAGTIALTSQILAMGDYTKFPSFSWLMITTGTILAYALMMGALGAIILATGGIAAGVLALGAVAVLGVAATIMGVDKILSSGDYTRLPSLQYSMSTVLLIGGFSAVMIATGLLIIPIMIGAYAVKKVAESIVEVDNILSQGQYGVFPSKDYAASVSLLLGGFSAMMVFAGSLYPLIWLGSKSISLVSEAIRDSSKILSEGVYTGGPTEQWAKGVSLAIGAFSQVYETLVGGGIMGFLFGGGGSSPEKMKDAIVTITEGILTAANAFSMSPGVFENAPPVSWAEGVGKAVNAFAPVYATLVNKGLVGLLFGGGGSSPEKMAKAIESITYGIIASAKIFSENKTSFENPPPEAWAKGVGESIKAFAPVFEYMNGGSWFTSSSKRLLDMVSGIVFVSSAIVASAEQFERANVQYTNYPSEDWAKGVGAAINGFSPVMKWVADNSSWFSADADDLKETIISMAESISATSTALDGGKYDLTIPDTFGKSMYSLFESYMKIYELISPMSGFFTGLENKIKSALNISSPTPESVAHNIVAISETLSSGKWDLAIPDNFGTNMYSLFDAYVKIYDAISPMANIFDGLLRSSSITPESVAQNIAHISRKLSEGNYTNSIPDGYMSSVYQNIKDFLKISELLEGVNNEEELFSFNLTATSGIAKLASDYDKLAQSVQSLSTAISTIDIDKIAALKSFTANVVLLSLMDPNQFEEMMEKLEEKSQILGDVFSQLSETSNEMTQTNVRRPMPVEEENTEMQDVVSIMNRMDKKLAQLVSYSGNLSSYVNELRTSGESVTLRK
jgi:hypothetical protein